MGRYADIFAAFWVGRVCSGNALLLLLLYIEEVHRFTNPPGLPGWTEFRWSQSS